MLPAIVVGWLAFGAVAVALMRHRGHDAFAWAIPFLVLGPLAVPIAISSDRHRPIEPERPIPPGGLDVLAFCDGTDDAAAALEVALTVVGDRATSVTLAAVVDLDATTTVRGHETQREAQDRLDDVARRITRRTIAPVGTVVLFGAPQDALQHYAMSHGFELIVAGSDTFGRSRLGKVRVSRAGGTGHTVPVLIGPGHP
jgi:nucleotide-binding universal stress UspA family protein